MDKGLTISEIVELSFIAVIVIIQIVVLINTWLHIERYKKFISDDDTLKLKSHFVPGYKLRSLSVEDVQGNEIYLSRIPSDKGANGEYSQFVDTGEVLDLGGAMREEDAVPQAIKDEWAGKTTPTVRFFQEGRARDMTERFHSAMFPLARKMPYSRLFRVTSLETRNTGDSSPIFTQRRRL